MVCNVHGRLLDAVESHAWHAEQDCFSIWMKVFFFTADCNYTESCGIVSQAMVLYERLWYNIDCCGIIWKAVGLCGQLGLIWKAVILCGRLWYYIRKAVELYEKLCYMKGRGII
jgi:hypothetical protein